jgi:hypothetical protein
VEWQEQMDKAKRGYVLLANDAALDSTHAKGRAKRAQYCRPSCICHTYSDAAMINMIFIRLSSCQMKLLSMSKPIINVSAGCSP